MDRNSGYDDDNLVDCDELDDCYVSDMKSLRILPVKKITTVIWNNVCCRKHAVSEHCNYMNDFI